MLESTEANTESGPFAEANTTAGMGERVYFAVPCTLPPEEATSSHLRGGLALHVEDTGFNYFVVGTDGRLCLYSPSRKKCILYFKEGID